MGIEDRIFNLSKRSEVSQNFMNNFSSKFPLNQISDILQLKGKEMQLEVMKAASIKYEWLGDGTKMYMHRKWLTSTVESIT